MKKWYILLIVAVVMSGCQAVFGATSTPVPALSPVKVEAGRVTVEAVAEPSCWVTLRATDGSLVTQVNVREGDVVSLGDALLYLDDTEAQLAITRAEAALAGVQAQLVLVQAGARPEEVMALEAELIAANGLISQTVVQTSALLDAWRVSGTEADVAQAQASIVAADFAYGQAVDLHQDTMTCFDVSKPEGGKETVCPTLGTYEEIARAQEEAAYAALQAAQAHLEALHSARWAQAAVSEAEVQLVIAQRDAVQAQLDLVEAGASLETVAAVKAAVRQAESALANARALLELRVLDAPFSGTVVDIAVQPGDVTKPGSALITLATLEHMWVRTKNLTELDIVNISKGQLAWVTFDARRGQSFQGQVVRVDYQGMDYMGEVVYPVYVELSERPAWLRWGMIAEIQIYYDETENVLLASPEVEIAIEPSTTVFAEAVVEPERWSELYFRGPGEVSALWVEPGTQVRAGDVIARLDATHAEAAVREAQAALDVAQAKWQQVQAGPRAGEISTAKAEVAATEGHLARAVAARDQLRTGAQQAQIAAVQAEIEAAEAEQRQLEADARWAEDGGDAERADRLRKKINVVTERIASERARLAVIPQIHAAQLRAADAVVRVAEARRDAALARLALAQLGPRSQEVAVAAADVQQAVVALEVAKLARARTELHAPYDGTVTQVYVEVGDIVTEDRPVAVLATLERLHFKTTDLLDVDVTALEVGQMVTIGVDALPDAKFTGRVTEIGLQSVLYRGDVTYPVLITLDQEVPSLLWGMKAVVEITR